MFIVNLEPRRHLKVTALALEARIKGDLDLGRVEAVVVHEDEDIGQVRDVMRENVERL